MMFIFILVCVISVIVLSLLTKMKVTKYFQFLKYINILNIILIVLLILSDLYIVEDRITGILLFLIYVLFGAIVLTLNVIFLLRNYFSKKKLDS
jgi:hypothetical protein